MMMLLRKALLPALAVVLLLSGSGCSRSSIIDDPGTVMRLGDDPQKHLVVWHTYSDEETIVFEKEVIPKFEEEHPGIRIEPVRQTHNQEYHSALMARLSAGKTPDIIRMDYSWVPLFADRGLLQPLDDFPEFDNVAGSLLDRVLTTSKYDGRTFGLPLNVTAKAAIYNAALLEKAGLPVPPSTFAEVLELAQTHDYIIGMSGIELWNSLSYFMALGGSLADERFTRTAGYFDSEQSIAAVEQLLDLYRRGVINPEMIGGNADMWREIYEPGRHFMIDEGPWYYSILLNSSAVNVDLLEHTVPAPFPSGGLYGAIIGGESLVMARDARHKPEAWAFIRWMIEKETQLMLYKAALIPVNTEAFEAAREAEGGPNRYIEPFMEGIDRAFYRPSIPQWNEIEKLYDAAMEAIFIRGSDIADTLASTARQMDALLGDGE